MQIPREEFYQIAMAQGQTRLARETFEEFYKRVMKLHEKREKNTHPYREHNAGAGQGNG